MKISDAKLAELEALVKSDAQPTCWRLPNGVGIDGPSRTTLRDLIADLREARQEYQAASEAGARIAGYLKTAEAERDAALRDAKLRSIHVREYGGRNERLRAERDRLREALETISRTKGPGDFVAFARAALSPRGENEET